MLSESVLFFSAKRSEARVGGFIERMPRGMYCTKEEVLCISILRLGRWNVYWELKRLIGLFVVNNVDRRRFEQGPLISLLSSSDAGGFLFYFFS